jgi:hypothetical protein
MGAPLASSSLQNLFLSVFHYNQADSKHWCVSKGQRATGMVLVICLFRVSMLVFIGLSLAVRIFSTPSSPLPVCYMSVAFGWAPIITEFSGWVAHQPP